MLQIANQVAGYSLGEADLLRRAMGKKKPEEMAKQRERFVSGCKNRQIDEKKANAVFDLMAEFAEYGFAKSHSTAYALITYQTAYLKANHSREFLAALMSADTGNDEKLARYIAHAREHKIDVLPPDVNESCRDFTVVAGGIRFGLAGVKNVGEGAIEAILEARATGERFGSLIDFCRRVDGRRMNRRVVESLVKCGAFDGLHPNRAQAWAGLDPALEAGAAAQRDREIGQASLFGARSGSESLEPVLPQVATWTDRERFAYEKEVLGFYVTGHPLSPHAAQLSRFCDTTAGTIEGKAGRDVLIGGVVTQLRETRTQKGKLMGFGVLEDLEGAFDLVLFPDVWGQFSAVLRRAAAQGEAGSVTPLLLGGTLEGGESPKLLVREVFELAGAEEKLSSQLRLHITATEATRDRLTALKDLARSPSRAVCRPAPPADSRRERDHLVLWERRAAQRGSARGPGRTVWAPRHGAMRLALRTSVARTRAVRGGDRCGGGDTQCRGRGCCPRSTRRAPGGPEREAALRAALAEAVVQVGLSLVANPDPVATRPRVEAALAGDPRDYTARYRVTEDRGAGPRSVLSDPAVRTEYAVKIEAQVDVTRVRARLVAAGLVPKSDAPVPVAPDRAPPFDARP